MDTAAYRATDKNAVLERVFPVLVNYGLENITIREPCKETGTVQGTLYYWFKDKTSIVCEAAQYGLKWLLTKYLSMCLQALTICAVFSQTVLMR